MKLSKILITVILAMFVSTGVFASSQNIGVTIDGVKLHMDVAPRALNNRTMVPMRAIFEAMGAKVEWDNNTSTATGIRGNDTIKLQIGNKKASINGKEVMIDVPATAVNGRTLVPTRFIAESLGAEVIWDDHTKTVRITTRQFLNSLSVKDPYYNINWLDYMGKDINEIIQLLGNDYDEKNYSASNYIEYHNSPAIFFDDYNDIRMLFVGTDINVNNKNIRKNMQFTEIENLLGNSENKGFSDYDDEYFISYNMSYYNFIFSSLNKSGSNWWLSVKDTRMD